MATSKLVVEIPIRPFMDKLFTQAALDGAKEYIEEQLKKLPFQNALDVKGLTCKIVK